MFPPDVPDFPSALAGTPPWVVACAAEADALLPLPVLLSDVPVAVALPAPWPGATFDAPLPVLPEDGAPEVSGTAGTPADPELPPFRVSGAAGVLTSTPLLGVPASERPLEVLPEPTAAGVLPGFDSLRRSQPARAIADANPHRQGIRAGTESFRKCPIASIQSM